MCEETNRIRQAEYDWKKDVDETKKDRTKDLHPSIKLMIENASATVCDNAGELGEKFMSLYNMKTHGGLDIELHQLFEDKGMGDVGFAEGVATNIWAGIFTRTQKSTPCAFSPFSFSEQTALSSKSDKDRSLLLEIYSSTKGGLIKSIDDVKTSAKTTVTVPQDFHSFLYQLKAFTFAVGFVFGEDSILATKLLDFVEKVDKNSIVYKNRIATDNTFAAKILWSVDCFTQLFLEDCRKCLDREDVNQRVIDFDGLNLDVLLYRFHMDLPSFFHIKSDDNDEPAKKGAFYLGCLTTKMLFVQRNYYKFQKPYQEPFLKYLQNINFNLDDLRKISLKLDTFHKYQSVLENYDLNEISNLEARVRVNLFDTNLSRTELSYAFTLGMTMQREFTFEAIRKAKENKENNKCSRLNSLPKIISYSRKLEERFFLELKK